MKKISLKDVKNSLKRDEMRTLVGGGCGSNRCGIACNDNDDCNCDATCYSCVAANGSKTCGKPLA